MIEIRDVELGDWARIYEWRNDDAVREMSKSQKRIPLSEHWEWFDRTMNSGHCVFLIATQDSHPRGAIRLDLHGSADVSLMVDSAHRDGGIGTRLLACGIKRVMDLGVKLVRAEIDQRNNASLRTFAKLGFRPIKFNGQYVTVELSC